MHNVPIEGMPSICYRVPMSRDTSGFPAFFPAPGTPGLPLVVSAPLAGLSHGPLRRIWARLGGCDLFFSEMVSAEALLSGSRYRESYLDEAGQGGKTIFQLVGASAGALLGAAEILVQRFRTLADRDGARHALGLDINMGCSAPEIVKQGAGVEWMKRQDEAARLLGALRKLIPEEDLSLSVKIRLGEEDDPERLVQFTEMACTEGVDFLTLHPRTRKDPWGRPAKAGRIGMIAERLRIPVVANGDLSTPERIRDFLADWSATHPDRACGGIMCGRGALTNPWIFRQTANLFRESPLQPPPREEQFGSIHWDRIALAREFHALVREELPGDFHTSRLKRFHAWFCRDLAFGNRITARTQSYPDSAGILPLFEKELSESPERFLTR